MCRIGSGHYWAAIIGMFLGVLGSFVAGSKIREDQLLRQIQDRYFQEAHARETMHYILQTSLDEFEAGNQRLPDGQEDFRQQCASKCALLNPALQPFRYEEWTYIRVSKDSALLISPSLAILYQRGTDCLVAEFPLRQGYTKWKTEEVMTVLSTQQAAPAEP